MMHRALVHASLASMALASVSLRVTDDAPVRVVNDPPERITRDHHKPSGSQPVAGGGARERERIRRRMEAKVSA